MFDIFGWIGAISYLFGYALIASHKLSASQKLFHILNIIGAIGVTAAAWHNGDTPSVVLNLAWGGIAIYGLITSE